MRLRPVSWSYVAVGEGDERKLVIAGPGVDVKLVPFTWASFRVDLERHREGDVHWLRGEFQEDANGNRGRRPMNVSLIVTTKPDVMNLGGESHISPPNARLVVGPVMIELPFDFGVSLYEALRGKNLRILPGGLGS